jgi:putative pyruvate formate lyase activating enzyme
VKDEVNSPPYISLFVSGELEKRAERLNRRLEKCDICPRKCGVNRLRGESGYCNSGKKPVVASFCDHHGEEPVISGTRGSGTIFFGNCNLRVCIARITRSARILSHNKITM